MRVGCGLGISGDSRRDLELGSDTLHRRAQLACELVVPKVVRIVEKHDSDDATSTCGCERECGDPRRPRAIVLDQSRSENDTDVLDRGSVQAVCERSEDASEYFDVVPAALEPRARPWSCRAKSCVRQRREKRLRHGKTITVCGIEWALGGEHGGSAIERTAQEALDPVPLVGADHPAQHGSA